MNLTIKMRQIIKTKKSFKPTALISTEAKISFIQGQRDGTADRTLSLHMTDLALIPASRMVPGFLSAEPGLTKNQNKTKFFFFSFFPLCSKDCSRHWRTIYGAGDQTGFVGMKGLTFVLFLQPKQTDLNVCGICQKSRNQGMGVYTCQWSGLIPSSILEHHT